MQLLKGRDMARIVGTVRLGRMPARSVALPSRARATTEVRPAERGVGQLTEVGPAGRRLGQRDEDRLAGRRRPSWSHRRERPRVFAQAPKGRGEGRFVKLAGVALFAAGYVIGTKAGRERYSQIVDAVGRGSQRLEEFSARRPPGGGATDWLPSLARAPSLSETLICSHQLEVAATSATLSHRPRRGLGRSAACAR